ncbi:telomere repeat binding factor-domain-containing protein [Scheffersomyces xylosifermentans]|uniref:telomere repeat binding factor-domain-containing protein n=1 Tax=Scheffersomyces xylosifermentans TaxID=1304137 RepID=UPI00315DB9E6
MAEDNEIRPPEETVEETRKAGSELPGQDNENNNQAAAEEVAKKHGDDIEMQIDEIIENKENSEHIESNSEESSTQIEVKEKIDVTSEESEKTRKRSNDINENSDETNDNKKQKVENNNVQIDLELQFDRAIEEHHREMSNPPEEETSKDQESTAADPAESAPDIEKQQSNTDIPTQEPYISEPQDKVEATPKSEEIVVNEKEDLAMIANELGEATGTNKKEEKGEESKDDGEEKTDSKSVVHDGLTVPANSELLNTNSALAAYNALSSQLPPLAVLAHAHLAALPLPIVAADYLPPRIQLLINTLPTLDNLATQLLRVVALGPYQKIIDLASNPETPAGATYRDLTSLFEFTKRLYSEEDPFLTVEHLAPGMWKEGEKTPSMFRNREQSIESTLRKVNLATFLAATLGTIEVGFFYLNESFLDVFCPLNNLDPSNALSNMGSNNMSLQSGVNTTIGESIGKLLKPQAVLYLDLKTQAYISAIEAGERSKEEILEDILPEGIEELLLSRRGVKALSPTESDFVERCKARKETLLSYSGERSLSEEYEWFTFLKDLFDYVSKNMGFLIWGKKGRTTRERSHKNTVENNTPHSEAMLNADHSRTDIQTTSTSSTVSSAVANTLASGDGTLRTQEINDITSALLPSEIQEQQIHLRINPSSSIRNLQRRPWTREEEKALRHALELKGPQWSTILELFGNGGKISEALKNRTQVQLKDKARNWKMFFLKSGLPVPAYLQRVTGDLERDDKSKSSKKSSRSKKTAAAPVPNMKQNPQQQKESAPESQPQGDQQ